MPQSEPGLGLDLSILVLSCDKYKDLWPVFSHYFEGHWGDCPFHAYIMTNEETFRSRRITSLPTGPDVGWSDSLMRALAKINTKYVLFLFDDFVMVSPFKMDLVREAVSHLERVGGNCVRLRPQPPPDVRIPGNSLFGLHSGRLPYRNSLVITIWNRAKLAAYLRPGETAWDFETIGQARTKGDEGFYAVWEHHFSFIHLVVKGRWFPSAFERIQRDLPGYSTTRPVMSPAEESLYKAYIRVRNVFVKLIGVAAFRAIHTTKWAIHSWLGPHQAKRLGRSVRKGQHL